MKHSVTALVLSFLLGSSVMASTEHNHGHGHGHGHEHAETIVSQEVVEKNAGEAIASLVERGKVDKSWLSIKPSSADKKIFNGHSEWVVAFVNKSISDTEKQTLYVFLTLGGGYIAANYSGH